ncbi:MAG: hypothetical protein R3B91_12750 [Planctomycetaceae bacterium]
MNLNAVEHNNKLGVSAYQFQHQGSRGSAARYLAPAIESLQPQLHQGMRVLTLAVGTGIGPVNTPHADAQLSGLIRRLRASNRLARHIRM